MLRSFAAQQRVSVTMNAAVSAVAQLAINDAVTSDADNSSNVTATRDAPTLSTTFSTPTTTTPSTTTTPLKVAVVTMHDGNGDQDDDNEGILPPLQRRPRVRKLLKKFISRDRLDMPDMPSLPDAPMLDTVIMDETTTVDQATELKKRKSWHWPWRKQLKAIRQRQTTNAMLTVAVNVRRMTYMKLSIDRPLSQQVILSNLMQAIDRLVEATTEAQSLALTRQSINAMSDRMAKEQQKSEKKKKRKSNKRRVSIELRPLTVRQGDKRRNSASSATAPGIDFDDDDELLSRKEKQELVRMRRRSDQPLYVSTSSNSSGSDDDGEDERPLADIYTQDLLQA